MMKRCLVSFLVCLLISPIFGQKKPKPEDPWLIIENNRFEKKTSILPNIALMRKGSKKDGLKGVSPWTKPIFAFVANYDTGDISKLNMALVFTSMSEDWRYLSCYDVKCLVDGEVLEMPKSERDGEVENGSVRETIFVPFPNIADLERLWDGKLIEFRICNTEFALSPIEMRVLQELKNYLLPLIDGNKANLVEAPFPSVKK